MKKANHVTQPEVFIVTGVPQGGKTTYVTELAEKLRLRGFACGGFVSPGKFEEGKRTSFEIVDLKTGMAMPLSSIYFGEGEKIGPFTFSGRGLRFGRKILQIENLAGTDFAVVDEIGPLELNNGGWADSLLGLLNNTLLKQIWVVRQSLVEEVQKKFGISGAIILPIDEMDTNEALKFLTNQK